jgi:two-component system phosphate regulon sensor histidine kinase PhoR
VTEGLQPVSSEIANELARLRARIAELEEAKQQLESRLGEATAPAPPITTRAELESTLRWFVRRVGLILQAEKCVLMLYNTETGELVAQSPALGLTEEEVKLFRVRATQGISGQSFRERRAIISDDAISDPRTVKENVALLKVRNILTVPLVLERKDEQGRVTDTQTIGVFHVFNKRGRESFSEDDIILLTLLARSAASVVSAAELYIAVSDEKRALEHTLQSMYSGVLVVGADGRIRLMNSAAKRIFSVPTDDGTGRPLTQIVPVEQVQNLVRTCLEEHQEAAEEISIQAPQERIFQVQASPLREDDGGVSGVVATLNDITELRNVERMKSEFVSTVSHELRTPLTSIKGFIRTLMEDTDGYYDHDLQMEFYRIIDDECDRLVRLISDLLSLSRIESGRALELVLKEVDLRSVAERVVAGQRSYTSQHEMSVEIPADFPRITADEDKLDQILTNLLSNAIKYSEGGKITLSAADHEGHVSISVSDQGLGIPEEHLPRLFSRFHRVDSRDTRQTYGTGIGLYLVKHLVEAHQGEITVKSKVGEGSTFTFTLPKVPPQREEEPGSASA